MEALNIGVQMQEGDVAVRANLVTLSERETDYEKRHILDHSAEEIYRRGGAAFGGCEASENEIFQFYAGTSYRHCLIWKQGMTVPLTPPHDIRGKQIEAYLPDEPLLLDIQKKSY